MDIDTEQPTERPNQNVTMTYENGELTISGLETDAVLIQASYSNGMITGIKFLDAENGTQIISSESGDKFLLWSSIASMYPLCPAVEVTDDVTYNNVLIAYFSRAGENWQVGIVEKGNTAVIADYISEEIDADVFEILPVVPYPEGYEDKIPTSCISGSDGFPEQSQSTDRRFMTFIYTTSPSKKSTTLLVASPIDSKNAF